MPMRHILYGCSMSRPGDGCFSSISGRYAADRGQRGLTDHSQQHILEVRSFRLCQGRKTKALPLAHHLSLQPVYSCFIASKMPTAITP